MSKTFFITVEFQIRQATDGGIANAAEHEKMNKIIPIFAS